MKLSHYLEIMLGSFLLANASYSTRDTQSNYLVHNRIKREYTIREIEKSLINIPAASAPVLLINNIPKSSAEIPTRQEARESWKAEGEK